MRDKTIRHYSEFDTEHQLELQIDDDANITVTISNISIFEPNMSIKFNRDGIKDLVEDLRRLVNE